MVREDPSYKNDILHYFTQYANSRGCHSVEQPHLPNHTWFLVITMFSIAVEPSTKHQYGDNDQNWEFCPLIGFQSTPFHLVFGLRSMAIQYNSVNEEIMWKDIVLSGKLKGI